MKPVGKLWDKSHAIDDRNVIALGKEVGVKFNDGCLGRVIYHKRLTALHNGLRGNVWKMSP